MFPRFEPKDLLEQIAQAQSTVFVVKDLNHRYLMVNRVFADLLQLHENEIVGRNDLELGISESVVLADGKGDSPGYWALDDDAVSSGQVRTNYRQGVTYRPESEPRDVLTTRTPLYNKQGEVVALLVQSRDVSDVSRLQNQLRENIKLQEDRLLALNDLMARMLAFREIDPLLQHLAETMIEYTDANNALILLVDETEEFIQVVASAGPLSKQNLGAVRYRGSGFAGVAWSTKRTQYISNCANNEQTKDHWPPGLQMLAVPLVTDDVVIGVVLLVAPSTAENFKTSTNLADHLAGLAAISITNAKAQEHAQMEIARMQALGDISQHLSKFQTAQDLLYSVSKTLLDAMETSRAVYCTVNEKGEVIDHAVWLRERGTISQGKLLSDDLLSETIIGWCCKNNQFAHLKRDHSDTRITAKVHEQRKELGIGSTLAMPINSDDKVVGVLTISRDLTKRDFSDNEISLFKNICSQVSSALLNRELSNALKFQAFHDSLTHLPNRRYFEVELEKELEGINDSSDLGAVLFLDLDGFKSVNDSLGHSFGDELLRQVAVRLRTRLRETDSLARIGGDEFSIIVRELSDQQEAIDIATIIQDSLDTNFDVNGAAVKIGTSIGLSFYPDDADNPELLLQNADEAMYRAKSGSKGDIVCFTQNMADESSKRIRLEVELVNAIKEGQFELYYQPQINSQTGEVVSVEALIRWAHPLEGFISPGEFIPVAEEAGLINQIGSWVLEEAVRQLVKWQNSPLATLRIGVNIAASQFLLDNFSEHIIDLLQSNNVSPSLLEIEVTERTVMIDVPTVIARLESLRKAGMRVAVDDFGTGYSSLSYLQDLPLDVLKIDRSFIKRLDADNTEQSVANTIMLLAKGLGLETVAEGVETEFQFEQVLRLGCNLIQGFYFSKPCAAADLPSAIEKIYYIYTDTRLRIAA